jgi:hypothetical protein
MFGEIDMRIDIPAGKLSVLLEFLEGAAKTIQQETGVVITRLDDGRLVQTLSWMH